MGLGSASHQISIHTIVLRGRLDALNAMDLRKQIDDLIEAGTVRIVVDIGAADFVDSAGLAALAKGMKECRKQGGDLRVVTPRNENAARVFALTRFDQVFVMGDSPDALVGSW